MWKEEGEIRSSGGCSNFYLEITRQVKFAKRAEVHDLHFQRCKKLTYKVQGSSSKQVRVNAHLL